MPFELQRRDIDCTTATYNDILLTGFNTHRGQTDWGQNLYRGGGAGFDTPGDSVDWWYNSEFSNYNTYGDAALVDIEATPPVYAPLIVTLGTVYGLFTQTVWLVCCLSSW